MLCIAFLSIAEIKYMHNEQNAPKAIIHAKGGKCHAAFLFISNSISGYAGSANGN